MVEDAPVNTGAVVWPDSDSAWATVRRMQLKLHRWAVDDPDRRFGDLFNLVYDPAFLVQAWERVANNTGARTGGVDRATVATIIRRTGVAPFLQGVRDQLKSGTFRPVPVREVRIPKAAGKTRRLGIPTVADRVVQAAVKLVLEPIFEADFEPCSYGFRPRRRAQDAIAEIQHMTTRGYGWVLEADIEACFDRIDHAALLDRVRCRVSDKRLLALVKAFLKAGVMTSTGDREDTLTGTAQGGILTPPTQWRTWCGLLVGVTVCGRGGGGWGAGVGGDGVADEDAFGADEDVFDQQAQDALLLGDGGGVGVAAELGEEVFEAGGELR